MCISSSETLLNNPIGNCALGGSLFVVYGFELLVRVCPHAMGQDYLTTGPSPGADQPIYASFLTLV